MSARWRAPKGAEQVENTAIIDLQSNSVVAVVVQRQGGSEAQWQWDEGKLVVTGADGTTDELELRQKAKEPPKKVADPWGKTRRPGASPRPCSTCCSNSRHRSLARALAGALAIFHAGMKPRGS